jgi:hypothetical protein
MVVQDRLLVNLLATQGAGHEVGTVAVVRVVLGEGDVIVDPPGDELRAAWGSRLSREPPFVSVRCRFWTNESCALQPADGPSLRVEKVHTILVKNELSIPLLQ